MKIIPSTLFIYLSLDDIGHLYICNNVHTTTTNLQQVHTYTLKVLPGCIMASGLSVATDFSESVYLFKYSYQYVT